MDHEERERKFEQALARHLRRDAAGARNEAGVRSDVRGETGGTATCPDAETLAAFHEGLLLSEKLNATTEHLAGCSRCQQILLHVEATDEIPLQAEAEEKLQLREPGLSTGALDVDYAPRQTPSVTIAGQPKPALRSPQDISHGRGFKALRWAAPAGAIAAGLLIWFVARDNKVQTPSQFDNVQVAQEQARDERLVAPRPLPVSPAPEQLRKSRQSNELRKDGSRVKQPARESGALAPPKGYLSDSISSRAEPGSSTDSSDATALAVERESRDYASRMAGRNKSPEMTSRQAGVSVTAAPTAKAPSDNSRAQSPAPASEAAKAAAKPSPNVTHAVVDGDGSAPPIPTEQVVTNEKLEFSPSLRKGTFENAKIIIAPQGKVRWRLPSEGRIERSSDGGITWLPQHSGVNVELLTGSAPSKVVCWIVGRGGTILKTTDGGGHWSQVAWPNAGEISGIQATDAMHAIVYEGTAAIPARFATNDGGVTWFRTNK